MGISTVMFNLDSFLQQLKHWLNLFRRHYSKRAGRTFIHIPNASGTSINHAFCGRIPGHYTYGDFKPLFAVQIQQRLVFSITSNPYNHMVTAYYFARMGCTAYIGMHTLCAAIVYRLYEHVFKLLGYSETRFTDHGNLI